MKLAAFIRRAREEMAAIPAEFRRDVEGPVIVRRARRHPRVPGMYTLGLCVPSPLAASLAGEHHSTVVLYYGSFVACSMRDPRFDVDAEIRETVRHEVRHHIEDRAGAPDLHLEDAAQEQNERRREGLPFRNGFHRWGDVEGPDLTRIDDDLFLEVRLDHRSREAARRDGLEVQWRGALLRVPAPSIPAPGDPPAYVPFPGAAADEEGPGDLVVVVPG